MLPDFIDLLTYPPEYDGAGGYETPENPTRLNRAPVNCRITTMHGEKNLHKYGLAGPNFRHVYVEPAITDVALSDIQAVALNSQSSISAIGADEVYRVKRATPQRDEAGTLHHTTLICELDDDLSS